MEELKIEGPLKSLVEGAKDVKTSKEESPVNSFSDMLKDSISQVNKLQFEAKDAVQELMTGEKKNIHETMIALQKADISFRMMMQVRNKILDAYREVMRMQV